jgi:hypothetical protein
MELRAFQNAKRASARRTCLRVFQLSQIVRSQIHLATSIVFLNARKMHSATPLAVPSAHLYNRLWVYAFTQVAPNSWTFSLWMIQTLWCEMRTLTHHDLFHSMPTSMV